MSKPPQPDSFAQAVELIRDGRTDEAETLLRGLSPLPPEGAEILARLLHNRAIAAFRPQAPQATEALLREALTLLPDLSESRRLLSELLFRKAQAAAQRLDGVSAGLLSYEAASLWPALGEVLPETAALAGQLHDTAVTVAADEPVASARLALAAWGLARANPDYYATARSIFVHFGTGELGKGVDAGVFEAMRVESPSDPLPLLGLANLHRAAGRANKAEELCRQAMRHPLGQPFAAGRLASALAEQRRFAEADALYRALAQPVANIERNIRLAPDFMASLAPRRPAQTLAGTPVEKDAELVVFTSCDGVYFRKYIDAFANSLARTSACRPLLHVHVVDPDADTVTLAGAIKQRLPELPFRLTTEDSPAGLTDKQRRVYFACARFLRLPELLEHYHRPVLMLDTDIVILRDVSPLLAQLTAETADLALVHGIPQEPWARLWADIVLAAPTAGALAYLDLVARYITHFFDRGDPFWFLDQVALYTAHRCGFADRAAPRMLEWPMDIQNAGLEHTYFWSLHVSQPNNSDSENRDLYLAFKNA